MYKDFTKGDVNGSNIPEYIDVSMISDSTSVQNVILFVERHSLIDNNAIFKEIDDFINTPEPQEESVWIGLNENE